MSDSRPVRIRPLTVAEFVVLLLVAWALWATSASAQLGPIKTAPIATSSSVRGCPPHACSVGTGGRHFALDGALGPVFVNPEAATPLDGTRAYGVPNHYTSGAGDGGQGAQV